MPRHGEIRNYHLEHETETFEGEAPDGSPVRFTYTGRTDSVCEKWCAGCGRWVESKGVLGSLRFMAEHGDHGARRSEA